MGSRRRPTSSSARWRRRTSSRCRSAPTSGGGRTGPRPPRSTSRMSRVGDPGHRDVPRLSATELADRAGVGSSLVDRLVELGIIEPDADGTFSRGDVYRARLLDDLGRAGISIESMAKVLEQGEISLSTFDLPVYERFTLVSQSTFREASERHHVPLELLAAVRESIGSSEPGADDLIREDELRILPLIELAAREGVPAAGHRTVAARVRREPRPHRRDR